jgi:phthiocerol/phenolphthiocerol synthesis type-I polyketide synthase E
MTDHDIPDPREAVAVVGMSGRFPGAAGLDGFWRNLCDGVESISTFSDAELAEAGIDPTLAARPDYVRRAGVLDGIERFDARFFGFSPREAELLDPQQRLFLEEAWKALEDGGIDPGRPPGRIGVFAGTGLTAYLLDHVAPRREALDPAGAYQAAVANDKDFLATRVSYKLDLRGPSLTVQTACSTSLVAVCLACQSLMNGECDAALAGGVTLRLPQRAGYVYVEEGILSPDGHCRAFDAAAAGTVPGSGVGVMALKRLSDALRDGDPVRAVLRGWALNNDGAGKAGFTAPRAEGQAEVIQEALALAEIDPATVGYVEAHGTGTRLGDPIEVAALRRAFSGADCACRLGSVKTNIGHLDSAAGVAGLIKAVLALQHRQIPPTLHFTRPSPEIDFGPFRVADRLTEWEKGDHPRRAGVSSFGIGGTNAHVVLEEAPAAATHTEGQEDRAELIVLSAKTPAALEAVTANLVRHLESHPGLDLTDVAFTLQAGRRPLEMRRALVVRSVADAAAALVAGDPRRVWTAQATPGFRPVAFLFPGQGTQHARMAAELYESGRWPIFRDEIDRCAAILEPHLGLDLRRELLAGDTEAAQRLEQTALAQPALFAVEHSLARLWMDWGIEPEALLGHSVGELVAACLAGVFSLEDGLALAAARGRLVQATPPGAMLSVPLSEDELVPWLEAELSLAAVNGPSLCAVSGPSDAIERLERRLREAGQESRRLHTSHAFHSALLEPAVAPFRDLVARVDLRPPSIPFLSNVTGGWIRPEEATDPDYWARHLRQPVRFAPAADTLLAEPRRLLLEVGPGTTLTTLVRRITGERTAGERVISSLPHPAPHPPAPSPIPSQPPGEGEKNRAASNGEGREAAPLSRRSGGDGRGDGGEGPDVEALLAAAGRLWLAGVPLDAAALHASGPRRKVALPTYPFEGERYWIERAERGKETSVSPLRKRPDAADWFYLPTWKRTLPPGALAAAGSAREGSWLIVDQGRDLGERLAERLRGRGWSVTLGDLEEGREPAPRRVVFLGDALGLVSLARELGRSIHSEVRIAVVTRSLWDVTGGEAVPGAQGALAGLAKVIPQEYPNLRCRLIDTGSGKVNVLAAELESDAGPPVVALRGSHRWEQVFEPLRLEKPASTPRLDPGGHYVITGGRGRFGQTVAEHLRSLGAKVTLLDLLEEGLDGIDVADPGAVTRALRGAVARQGRIHGVLHAAGAPPDDYRTLAELSAEDLERHLRPKVDGAVALRAALRELGEEPGFCIAASSLAAVLGGVGLGAFAASDAALDALLGAWGPPWISVNWEVWQAIGGGAAAFLGQQQNELMLTPAELLETLERVLAVRGQPRLAVATGDLGARLKQWTDVLHAGRLTAHARPESGIPYRAPGDPVEARIVEIWQELLGVDRIGVDDDFFLLGGNSLAGLQILSRLRADFDVELPLKSFFEARTVAAMAVEIRREQEKAGFEKQRLEEILAEIEGLSLDEVQMQLAAEEEG